MYSMLLVATPFVMLRRFLQEAIGKCSRFGFDVGSVHVPAAPAAALVVVVWLLFRFRAQLTRRRLAAGLLGVVMIAVGQHVNDYYFDHRFYDLQQNWHYLAYALFAFMVYRDLAPRGVALARILLITFLTAASFSSLDEAFQLRMSSRVFEMGDVAKDVWGTLVGMVVVYLGENRCGALLADWSPIRHRRLRDYWRRPSSVLLLLGVLGFLLMVSGSLFNHVRYWHIAIALTGCGFVAAFVLLHVTQFRWVRYAVLTVFVVAVVTQAMLFARHHADGIVYTQRGLTVYKGIPIPLVDVLVFPNGTFWPVDKKEYFSPRDRRFLLRQAVDIVVVTSGTRGIGGRGFPQPTEMQFLYNPYTKRGTQVFILKNDEACALYNRLRRSGKSVLLVLHNS